MGAGSIAGGAAAGAAAGLLAGPAGALAGAVGGAILGAIFGPKTSASTAEAPVETIETEAEAAARVATAYAAAATKARVEENQIEGVGTTPEAQDEAYFKAAVQTSEERTAEIHAFKHAHPELSNAALQTLWAQSHGSANVPAYFSGLSGPSMRLKFRR